MVDLEKIKAKLLTIGVIDYRLYSDTSFIYLMTDNEAVEDGICLANYEFDDDMEDAMIELYKIVVEKGLINE